MKSAMLITCLLLSALLSAQTLTFTVKGAPDDEVYLARYYGPELHYADTANMQNGVVRFDGSKHIGGLYALYFKNGSFFEFIHDNETVDMATDTIHLLANMKINESVNNKVFYAYMDRFNAHQEKLKHVQDLQSYTLPGSATYDSLSALRERFFTDFKEYQLRLITDNKGLLIADMVRMSMNVDLPPNLIDSNGEIRDAKQAYNFFISHYWDHYNLKDPRLVHIPAYHHRLVRFFTAESMSQHQDTIIHYASWLLTQMDLTDSNNRVFQYTLTYIMNRYYNSPFLGMDKITWFLGTNYYCPPNNKAYWMKPEELQQFCYEVSRTGGTLVGNLAPSLILPDTTEKNWIDIHQIEADYTILFFWNPTCDHCLETIPKLSMLYNQKFKERNIAVVAVAGVPDGDFEVWKKYIVDNKLEFVNIGMTPSIYQQAREQHEPLLQHTNLESLNYDLTWNIVSTPQIFVLDKDKKILYKELSIVQLEDLMDQHTGHANDPKLFPAVTVQH